MAGLGAGARQRRNLPPAAAALRICAGQAGGRFTGGHSQRTTEASATCERRNPLAPGAAAPAPASSCSRREHLAPAARGAQQLQLVSAVDEKAVHRVHGGLWELRVAGRARQQLNCCCTAAADFSCGHSNRQARQVAASPCGRSSCRCLARRVQRRGWPPVRSCTASRRRRQMLPAWSRTAAAHLNEQTARGGHEQRVAPATLHRPTCDGSGGVAAAVDTLGPSDQPRLNLPRPAQKGCSKWGHGTVRMVRACAAAPPAHL